MNKLILVLFASLAFIIGGIGLTACSSESDHSHDTEQSEGDHAEGEEGHDHAGHDHDHAEGDHEGHDHAEGEGDEKSMAFTAAYVCPMHCENSGSEEAGNCPTCGMAYVANADHNADGHSHEE